MKIVIVGKTLNQNKECNLLAKKCAKHPGQNFCASLLTRRNEFWYSLADTFYCCYEIPFFHF